ncbi:MAG TPA: POTRA domain-containing protein, partial [Burkholderiaceae bacterium]|nr:POTRA domain-containing protein [Burkholderiaceae bacterium]
MSFLKRLALARHAAPFIVLAALVFPALGWAFSPFAVKDIQVEGVQRVDPGTIFSYLPVKVGDEFTEEQAAEAIQRLYATGFFNDVQIQTDNDILVVVVNERPTIASVTFNGMREFDSKVIVKALADVGFGKGRV